MTNRLRLLVGAVAATAPVVALVAGLAVPAEAASLPNVVTGPPSAVSVTAATLAGDVNPNGATTSWTFQYGTTSSFGLGTPYADAGAGASDVTTATRVTGLTPGTTYDYRLVAKSAEGVAYGSEDSFHTPAVAPTISKTWVDESSDTRAVIDAEINPNGLATSWTVRYGATTALGDSSAAHAAGSGIAPSTTGLAIGGLTPDTSYFADVVATNAAGSHTSSEISFSTTGAAVISAQSANVLSTTETELTGTIRPNGHTTHWYFQYGPTTSYGVNTAVKSAGAATTPVAITKTLVGLTPNATYQYRLVAESVDGVTLGQNASFTMPGPTLQASAGTVTFGRSTTLSGTVPNGAANQEVAIYAEITPNPSFALVTTVLTGTSGTWAYVAQPTIATSYKVLWGGEVSPIVTVGVSPSVTLRERGLGAFVTHVVGAVPFTSRLVRLQRLEHGVWRTVASRKLNRDSAATLRVSLSGSTANLRIYLTAFQAGAGYQAGYSSARRFHI